MNNKIPLRVQAGGIKSYFPDAKIRMSGNNEMTVVLQLTPSHISQTYTVAIKARLGNNPDVYVINQTLPIAKGQEKLPHVYPNGIQHLCIYYRNEHEWRPNQHFVHTIIPWSSEWLYFYELWLPEGIWYGGGIEHS